MSTTSGSDFAALGVGQLDQRRVLVAHATAEASASMAHELAHEINNPLQSIANLMFLAMSKDEADGERILAMKLGDDMARLNDVARRMLELPRKKLDSLQPEKLPTGSRRSKPESP